MPTPTSFESPVMIGRAGDLDELRQALRAAVDGQPAAVLVEGEAGIGKSRLVREFAAEAGTRQDALVLTGRCLELGEEGPPYAPFVSVLRQLVRSLGPEAATEAITEAAGPIRDTLAVLLPELAEQAGPGAGPGAGPVVGPGVGPVARDAAAAGRDEPTGHPRGRLYEAVAGLLERAATRRPVVVVLEDLHDADTSTRDLFRFLVHALDCGNVLLLGTCRSDALHRRHPLRGFLAELDRSRRLQRIRLERLTPSEVDAQLAAILSAAPDPEVARAVHQRTEGIPFFVEELVAAGSLGQPDGPLPMTLRDLLLVRFEQLAESTQRVLRLLATGSSPVAARLLVAVHGGEEEELDEAVREAVSANILRVVDDGYAFRHALVREAVADDLLPGERVRHHVRYAEALSADPDLVDGPGRAIAQAAYHWFAAHHNERAFAAYATVLRGSAGVHAYRERHGAGERLLELWDRVDDPAGVCESDHTGLLVTTATLATENGEYDRARALLDAALAELDPAQEPARYADTLRLKAFAVYQDGRHGAGLTLLREALRLVPADPPSELRGSILHQLGTELMLLDRFAEAIPVTNEAIELSEALGVDAIAAHAYNTRGTARAQLGEIEAGMADLRRAGELSSDSPAARHRFSVNFAHLHYMRGDYAESLRLAEEGIAYARSLGVARTQGVFQAANTASTLIDIGQWDRAEESITEFLDLDPPPGHRNALLCALAQLRLLRGDPRAAAELLATARTLLRGDTEDRHEAQFRHLLSAEVALESGEPGQAADQLLELARSWTRPADRTQLLVVTARAVVESGRVTDQLAAELRALADAPGHPGVPPWRAMLDAELAGRDPESWRVAREAALDERAPAYTRAYTSCRHAEALLAAGDRGAAREALTEAERLATELGAGLIISRIDRLRSRSGLEPDVDRPGPGSWRPGVEPLTNRERQVLALVAEGLSNRQIGERLFISTKTASVHVSNLLRKLDVATRTEAAAVAYTEGLVEMPAPAQQPAR